jgi:Flp pilus assembly protein TadD
VVRTRTSGEVAGALPTLGGTAGIAIGAAALMVRGVHLWQIHGATFYTVLVGDAKAYDRWALQISGGDWIGSGVFYQAPLYPYLLAALYRLFGHDLTLVRLAQTAGGAAACMLLAAATTRLFGRRAGIAAGLLLAFYPAAIFFDGIIQKSAVDALLLSILIWQVSRLTRPASHKTAHPSSSFAIGVVMAALMLTRENALVLVPLVALWLARSEHFATRRLRHAAAFAAGLSLLLAPVLARNAAVGGGVNLTTSQAGPNFYIGNHPGATGMYQPLRVGRGTAEFEQTDATELAQSAVGHVLAPGDVSAYWMRRAGDYIGSQPGQWLALTGKKTLLLVNAVEVADTEALEQQAERSVVLRLAGVVNFGMLLPLAALGLWSHHRRIREYWLLPAMCAAYGASVLLFYVSARYRYPLVPFVIVFAAAGLAALPSVFAATSWGSRVTAGAIAASVAVAAHWPVLSSESMRATSELNLGVQLQADGRLDEAIERYRIAVRLSPNQPDGYLNLGTVLHVQGRVVEAEAQFATAAAVAPRSAEAHYFLAKTMLENGRTTEAIDQLVAAVRLSPDLVDARTSLGVSLARQGRFPDAIEQFRVVSQRSPESSLARWNLGSALAAEGQFEEAVMQLGAAVRLDPSNTAAIEDLQAAREFLAAARR